MARHYTIKDFFQQMLNALLADISRDVIIFFDLGFSSMKR